jgi:hypothetical protein
LSIACTRYWPSDARAAAKGAQVAAQRRNTPLKTHF